MRLENGIDHSIDDTLVERGEVCYILRVRGGFCCLPREEHRALTQYVDG